MLSDRLHLTFGGRYSEDTRKAQKNQNNQVIFQTQYEDLATGNFTYDPATVGALNSVNVNAKGNFHDDSYEFIAEYDWLDDVSVFARWVEGYKSGGFNIRDPDPQRFEQGFEPEKIESMELGIKSELFERRVRLNATAFWSDYKDIQVNFLLPNSLDADMKKVDDPDTGEDVTDEFQFYSAPENSYAATLDYTWPAFSWANIDANLTYNYTSSRAGSSRTSSGDNTKLDSYGLLSARVALSSIYALEGEWTVAAWMRNALDEDYNISAVDNQASSSRAVLWGEPRSYGLEVMYRY